MNIKPEQIPDEVVEAMALSFFPNDYDTHLRKMWKPSIAEALATALPVLLGEPVGWQRRYRTDGMAWSSWHDWPNPEFPSKSGRWVNEFRPIYALSTQDAHNDDQ